MIRSRSIAAPGPSTTLYGGNTACVELRSGQDILVFDAGTGIRELGLSLAQEFRGRALTVHLFVSHTHWDHIQGFPFFKPAYLPGFEIVVYGAETFGKDLRSLFSGQLDRDYFPVQIGDMRATKKTPAVTMVAAWIRAETGVGPSIASGSQVCSRNCADLPIEPMNSRRQTAVTAWALSSCMPKRLITVSVAAAPSAGR